MGLLDYIADKYDQLQKYKQANTPKSMALGDALRNSGKVVNEGLLNPTTPGNIDNANRFKDSVFGLLGIVPGVGDISSAVEAADIWNRGEKGTAMLAGLGALPLIPSMAGVTAKNNDYFISELHKSSYGRMKQEEMERLADMRRAYLERQASGKSKYAATKAKLTLARNDYADVIDGAHKNASLDFNRLPDGVFAGRNTFPVYQSPSYGKKQGSSYRLVMVDGRPAYARESDHWGDFGTKEWDEITHDYYTKNHTWNLAGLDKNDGNRYAGYIFLDDLTNMKNKAR
jgi:hypothetical protein